MEEKVSYDCVSEFAGHQTFRDVEVVEAAKDIFAKVKEKSMECAVNGEYIAFQTIEELSGKLKDAAVKGVSIRIVDQNIAG